MKTIILAFLAITLFGCEVPLGQETQDLTLVLHFPEEEKRIEMTCDVCGWDGFLSYPPTEDWAEYSRSNDIRCPNCDADYTHLSPAGES